MDEIYGFHISTSNNHHEYTERGFMSPENLIIPGEYQYHQYNNYHSLIGSADHGGRVPVLGSDGLGLVQSSVLSESASINNIKNQRGVVDDEQQAAAASVMIKAKIASHPSYPKLLDAYIDCQKVGAPPEIACLLEEIRRDKELLLCKQDTVSTCYLGIDPELDEFMETYCDILVKYKSDLSRPFDEAISFLNKIETQLGNLSKDDGGLSSEEELSGGETEVKDAQVESEDRELKHRLLHRYGSHISSLKLEFSKKTKKGKLPKEAKQMLHGWWNDHCRWPYPTEGDKISLAQSTGLDQKQINNWFINQRKRHWKPSENMQLAIMENLYGHSVRGN